MTRIFLVNVGANLQHRSRARSPLFSNGRFVFVPFPYNDEVRSQYAYPNEAWPFTNNVDRFQAHIDPDWKELTYGDYVRNPRASALAKANKDDILLFWALLWSNTGDSWNHFTNQKSWHLIGAMRIDEVLRVGQRSIEAKPKNRNRAALNDHFDAHSNAPLDEGHMVFIAEPKRSMLFDFAVPFVTSIDQKSLMYRTVRTSFGAKIPLGTKKWSSYVRSCRVVCDLSEKDGRNRATILSDAISKRNHFGLLD